MTEREAVEKLKAYSKCQSLQVKGIYEDCNNKRCDNCSLCYMQGTTGEHLEAIDIAIKALDKQTPKKIVIRERTESFIEYVCPECKNVIMTEIIRNGYFGVCTAYCSECGQRLDWSNIENGEETDETD